MNEKTKKYMKENGMIFDSQVRFLTTTELKNKAFDFLKERLDYLISTKKSSKDIEVIEEDFLDTSITVFDFIDFVEKR